MLDVVTIGGGGEDRAEDCEGVGGNSGQEEESREGMVARINFDMSLPGSHSYCRCILWVCFLDAISSFSVLVRWSGILLGFSVTTLLSSIPTHTSNLLALVSVSHKGLILFCIARIQSQIPNNPRKIS